MDRTLLYCDDGTHIIFEITNHFWADLLPVGGPVLGPFKLHDDAIAAEIAWLQAHNFPERK